MSRIVVLILYIIFVCQSVCANQILPHYYEYSPKMALKTREFVMYKQKYYALYFNALSLDYKQSIEFEKNLKNYDKMYNDITDKLIKETKKYELMKENHLPILEISEQKKIINSLYKDLKKISKTETKSLKTILNKEQLQRYKLLNHLESHDIKKSLHEKDYYKSNPKMTKFGNPAK